MFLVFGVYFGSSVNFSFLLSACISLDSVVIIRWFGLFHLDRLINCLYWFILQHLTLAKRKNTHTWCLATAFLICVYDRNCVEVSDLHTLETEVRVSDLHYYLPWSILILLWAILLQSLKPHTQISVELSSPCTKGFEFIWAGNKCKLMWIESTEPPNFLVENQVQSSCG